MGGGEEPGSDKKLLGDSSDVCALLLPSRGLLDVGLGSAPCKYGDMVLSRLAGGGLASWEVSCFLLIAVNRAALREGGTVLVRVHHPCSPKRV